ncbi:MAG: hypothetical protein LC793_05630 [Thermomicrobia bacterium]|nr:hypothetical protein [Thermomicrobia bacterium]
MRTRIGTILALLMIALMVVANTPVAAAPAPEATTALVYLRAQQNADGGYPGFSGPASDSQQQCGRGARLRLLGRDPR